MSNSKNSGPREPKTGLVNRREHVGARKGDVQLQAGTRGGRPTQLAGEVDETASKSKPLERLSKELESVPKEAARRVNAGMVETLIRVRGAVVWVRNLLPEIMKALPQFDPRQLDDLELRASAFAEADCKHKLHVDSPRVPPDFLAEGLMLRRRMLADVRALVAHQLVSEDALKRMKGGTGYQSVAVDLLSLAGVIRANAKAIQGRCATSPDEVERAEAISNQLCAWLGEQMSQGLHTTETALTRGRAFTLLSEAYTEMRRIIQYVRFYEGDANEIVPPLSGMRTGKRKKANRQAKKTPRGSSSRADVPSRDASVRAGPLGPPANPGGRGKKKPPPGSSSSDPFLN